MSVSEPTAAGLIDPYHPRLARAGSGLLASFNAAGVLSGADVHVATRLGRLGGESEPAVLLAAALAVRAVRQGAVCIELDRVASTAAPDAELGVDVRALPWPETHAWRAAVAASPLVAVGGDRADSSPLRLVDDLLYLDRYWRQEQLVRDEIAARAIRPAPPLDEQQLLAALHRLFPAASGEPDHQRLAAAAAALGWLTVVAGGPGTGKTTTVARLLAVLREVLPSQPRIALAAPTGKAAARLQEAVSAENARLVTAGLAPPASTSASTLHRLLGFRPGSHSRFKHDRTNRLPFDVVVVDETSMVSLTLMSRLLEAVRPDARLVLVGDPDQLASVEAGAVLGDLVQRSRRDGPDPRAERLAVLLPGDVAPADEVTAELRNDVVRLRKTHRYGGTIGTLAAAIRSGQPEQVLEVLRSGAPDVSFVEVDSLEQRRPAGLADLRADVQAAGQALLEAARAGDVPTALGLLDRHRLLCAHRKGPYGVERWGAEVERWLEAVAPGHAAEGEWHRGRPLLVTANDYDVKLYNGDTGVVVDDGHGRVVAAFASGAQPVLVSPTRLSAVETVHAMTVHKSQGSQFERVSVLLPPAESPLLTRELLYTAVTRARQLVRVVGSAEAVEAAVRRPIVRASGLRSG